MLLKTRLPNPSRNRYMKSSKDLPSLHRSTLTCIYMPGTCKVGFLRCNSGSDSMAWLFLGARCTCYWDFVFEFKLISLASRVHLSRVSALIRNHLWANGILPGLGLQWCFLPFPGASRASKWHLATGCCCRPPI